MPRQRETPKSATPTTSTTKQSRKLTDSTETVKDSSVAKKTGEPTTGIAALTNFQINRNLNELFAMKLKAITKLLTKEILPENNVVTIWAPLCIAVVCFAVGYTHSQQSDDGFLTDDDEQLSTQANDYKKARSLKAQMLDNLTDEELALYCALTGETAAQLDKEESEFKKALLAKPEIFEEHVEDFLKNHPEPKNDQQLLWRIYVGSEIAKQRLMRGSLTIRQQLELGRKNILANNQKYYQSVTNYIAKSKESVKFWADREERAKQKNRSQFVKDEYKYRRMESELRLAQDQAVLELYRPLWVHLGILPEDEVNKKDETINNGALLQMSSDARGKRKQRQQAIWDGRSQELKTWQAEEEKIKARFATMTNEEIERWDDMAMFVSMRPIALDDAKFALWRASVNEAASPPAQNPGGLLLEETSPLPAPVTNTDDSGETSPAPSPGSEEETTSGGSLGDDASPGSPTVPGDLE